MGGGIDNNHDDDDHLVDADGLVLVGEVAGEQVQGGSGGVNLHCALNQMIKSDYFPLYQIKSTKSNVPIVPNQIILCPLYLLSSVTASDKLPLS